MIFYAMISFFHLKNKKAILYSLLIPMFSLILCGCSTKQSVQKSGFYFDTIINIRLYDDAYEDALDECFEIADHYDCLFDSDNPESDIYRINHANGAWVTVDTDTIEVVKTALTYAKLSSGAFDITIGSVTDLWDFTAEEKKLPDNEALSEACSHVGYDKIQIDGTKIRLTDSSTKLDLGGVAKGYIADKMKAYLNEQGITEGIINLGGNVLTVGAKDGGEPYRIGIQKPFAEDGTSIEIVSVQDRSVVSSGVYQRYFYLEEHLYHHILNPKTGYPYNNGLYGVTILSASSLDGDCLSTTCFALGLEEGMKLIESLDDVEALFITDDMQLHYSSGFPK